MKSAQPDDHKLSYHSEQERHLHGCVPLFCLVTLAILGVLVYLLQIEMPKPLEDEGEAQVFYRQDEVLFSPIRQSTPLPIEIPAYADPAMRYEHQPMELPLLRVPQLYPAPVLSPFARVPASAVLSEDDLLELPPLPQDKLESAQPAAEHAPDETLESEEKP